MKEILYWTLEVALLVICLRSRRSALMVLAFSLPLCRRLPSLPLPILNYENLVFIVVMVSFAIHPTEKRAGRAHIRHWLPLAVLALFTTVSYANTMLTFEPKLFWRFYDPYRVTISYKAAMLCFLGYVLASLGVRSMEDLVQVARAAVGGILFESLYTAAEYVLFHPGRATGHMDEPNNMGAYLAGSIALLASLVLSLPPRSREWKWVAAGVLGAVVALLGTLSRGAFLGTMAGFGAVTAIVNRKALAVGIALVALGGIWLPEGVKNRLQSTFVSEEQQTWRFRDGQGDEASDLIALVNERLDASAAEGELAEGTRLDSSLQLRLVVWGAASRMIQDYPLGVGYGVFPWHMQFYSNILKFKATHNVFLKVATESGVPALVAFLAVIVLLARDSLRVARSATSPELRGLGYGMFGYIIALSVCAFSVDTYFQTEVNGQFWLMMGILMQAFLLAPASTGEKAGRDPGANEPPKAGGETSRPAEQDEIRPLYELAR